MSTSKVPTSRAPKISYYTLSKRTLDVEGHKSYSLSNQANIPDFSEEVSRDEDRDVLYIKVPENLPQSLVHELRMALRPMPFLEILNIYTSTDCDFEKTIQIGKQVKREKMHDYIYGLFYENVIASRMTERQKIILERSQLERQDRFAKLVFLDATLAKDKKIELLEKIGEKKLAIFNYRPIGSYTEIKQSGNRLPYEFVEIYYKEKFDLKKNYGLNRYAAEKTSNQVLTYYDIFSKEKSSYLLDITRSSFTDGQNPDFHWYISSMKSGIARHVAQLLPECVFCWQQTTEELVSCDKQFSEISQNCPSKFHNACVMDYSYYGQKQAAMPDHQIQFHCPFHSCTVCSTKTPRNSEVIPEIVYTRGSYNRTNLPPGFETMLIRTDKGDFEKLNCVHVV